MNAIYEGGQLRLLQTLSLPEHTLVQVRVDTVEPDAERAEWLAQSERSLSKVWDNDADDVYNELLEPSRAASRPAPPRCRSLTAAPTPPRN